MKADLFSRRGLRSNEFLDDGKDVSELTRDFPITQSSHQPTNAVHPAASPHAVLLVVFLLKSFDLASEIAIRINKPAQLHERAHNCDIDFCRTPRTQDTLKHCNALFGKGIRAITCAAMLP
jgi:hypothetical protein